MHTCYQLHVGNESPKLPDPRKSLGKYQDFPSPKIRFSSHKIQLFSTAFRFLQRLSAFFNGFLIFLNGFPIFLNGFLLSKKSEKICLWWQVYVRSPFKLRISRHLLPELRNRHSLPKLCNCHLLSKLYNCYNAYISPNTLVVLRALRKIGIDIPEGTDENDHTDCTNDYANHFFDAFNNTSMFKRRDVDFIYELAENTTPLILDKNLNKDSLTVQVMK